MNVTQRYYTGAEQLAIKVIQDSYDSDPDVFISKVNKQPMTQSQSTWYCVKDGSDTCIIKNNQINFGDIIYIGIRCINQCNYQLRAYYTTIRALTESTKTQIRLEGVSTSIFQYYIPQDASDGFTTMIKITVESEEDYMPIDMHLSLDDDIFQIEERKNPQITQYGKAFSFTNADYNWCTRCFVYLLVDVMSEGRYYITATASARSDTIYNGKTSDKVINARQQQCFSYYVSTATNDAVFSLKLYQGEGEIYISGKNQPSNIADSNVGFIAEKAPLRSLIATAEDRQRYGFGTGLYYVCVFAYSDLSFAMSVNEQNYNQLYDAVDNMLYTFNLEKDYYLYFRYTTADLALSTTISLYMNAYGLNSGQVPPKIYYKVCSSGTKGDCYLDDDSAKGKNSNMKEIGTYTTSKMNMRTGTINHNPSVCSNPKSCYYLFSIYFPDTNGPLKTAFKISHDNNDPHNVNLDSKYKNIKNQGTYEWYELLPGSSTGFHYLQSLAINLQTFSGDADLVVSFTNRHPTMENYTYQSLEMDGYDQVLLNGTSHFLLNRPIYIGVYAQMESEYELSFRPTYSPDYQELLTTAKPLVEGSPVYNYMANEYAESFYSYRPMWTGAENRTIVFFAQMIFNNLFFYADVNNYPTSYLTNLHDSGDMIVIRPSSFKYDRSATYFIRVRPDFALYDLISKRQYIFNFYAISQPQNDTFIDLQVNETITGWANASTTFYKHHLIQKNDTLVFSIVPLMGNPTLLIKIANEQSFPNNSDSFSYDYRTVGVDNKSFSLTLDFDMRQRAQIYCDYSGFPLNGGNNYCRIFSGVYCASQCAYNITMSIKGREQQRNIPKYLTEKEYYTGSVNYGQIKYFYYPVSNNTGDLTILLNKTANIGQNGKIAMMVNIQRDSSGPFESWTYPVTTKYLTASVTNSTSQPEMVELCQNLIRTKCSNTSCVVIIGLYGMTVDKTSTFRLRVYTGSNKLTDKKPVSNIISKAGQYHYYWFTSNATVINPKAYWEYSIATSVSAPGQDVDLYVTMMDGRMPVSSDFDLQSSNVGPDNVVISSNDTFFSDRNYNTSNGIIFVVGVKALTNDASYSLMMVGPQRNNINFFELTNTNSSTKTFLESRNRNGNDTHYYKFYNWGHKDFKLTLDVTEGLAYVYLNYMSEENIINNGYLATPQNMNNSRWVALVNATQSNTLRVYKEDINNGYFCYYCIYYVKVFTNTSKQTTYRLSYLQTNDAGDDITQVVVGRVSTFTLPSTGTVVQRKFLLESKDPFSVSVTLSTGYVVVYVGLYPDQPLTKYAWRAEGGIGTTQIKVRQTDLNFHQGTFYYVTIQATQGRSAVALTVKQDRTINMLTSGIQFKDEYWAAEERVKFYFFQVPRGAFKATLSIAGVTEDFYPTIVLTRNNLTSSPSDFRNLQYPNLMSYTSRFGDNYSYLVNQKNASYSIVDTATTAFTYYTVAVYSFSYGLTDRRKAEFKLLLTIDTTNTKLAIEPSTELKAHDKFTAYLINNKSLQKAESTWSIVKDWAHTVYAVYQSDIHKMLGSYFVQ